RGDEAVEDLRGLGRPDASDRLDGRGAGVGRGTIVLQDRGDRGDVPAVGGRGGGLEGGDARRGDRQGELDRLDHVVVVARGLPGPIEPARQGRQQLPGADRVVRL